MPALSKSVEYAIHSLVYLVDCAKGKTMTIKSLAEFQNITESYLAKIFTRLKKGGIVKSNIGVSGGYTLARDPALISFWDIVVAVEGQFSFFECRNVRERCAMYEGGSIDWNKCDACTIHQVMNDVEKLIAKALMEKNLRWLCDTIDAKTPEQYLQKKREWLG